MTLEEAMALLDESEGRWHTEAYMEGSEVRLRVKYTGTDPEEEGRIAEALLFVAGEAGATMRSLETDNVHLASDVSQPQDGAE